MIKKFFINIFKNAKQNFFINNIRKELSDEQRNELDEKTIEINASRAIIIALIVSIIQIGFIVSDHINHFYQVDSYAILNMMAELLALISTLVIGVSLVYLTNKTKLNYKLIKKFYYVLYICMAIAFSIYCFSDIYRGVFCGTIFFISIIYGFVPYFRTLISFVFFVFFFLVFVIATLTAKNVNVTNNNTFVTAVVYMASFFISVYLRHNYIRSFADEVKLKKLNKELLDLSQIDFLTTVANRRGLELYIDEHITSWSENNNNIGIICTDIDNFKKYNDEYTHPVGDECLKQVSSILKEKAIKYDGIAARVGGEEMTLLLTKVDSEKRLVEICEEIRKDIYKLHIKHATTSEIPYITISLGGNYLKIESKNQLQREIDKTDIELYNAKDNGRNRTSVANKIYGGSID